MGGAVMVKLTITQTDMNDCAKRLGMLLRPVSGLAAADIGCDLDGYPVRALTLNALRGSVDKLKAADQARRLEAVANPEWFILPCATAPQSDLFARIVDLETQITHLRSLLNRVTPERLSSGWEHLPDVAAPPVRMMPARALRGGDGVPR